MKRALVGLVLVVGVALTIDLLGDLTQDRPDRVAEGSHSEIVLEVTDKGPRHAEQSAERLWSACAATVGSTLAEPGLVPLGGERWLAVAVPAVGERSWRRLQGCLHDMTLDRIRAEVVSKRDYGTAR